MSEKEAVAQATKSPLDALPMDVRERVEELKHKGNPVQMSKVGDQDYIYFGMLREDFVEMKLMAMKYSEKLLTGITEESPQEEQMAAMAKMEDLEEMALVSFAVLSPSLDIDDLYKFPAGRVRKLRDLILMASGEGEEVTEPVSL